MNLIPLKTKTCFIRFFTNPLKKSIVKSAMKKSYKIVHYFKYFTFIAVLVVLSFTRTLADASNNLGEICFDCHTDLKNKIQEEKAHAPVAKGNCIVCHNPHTSKYKGLLNEVKENLCFICHKNNQGSGFNRTFVHSPVQTGNCLACHDPHSSTRSKLHVKNSGDICF